MRGEVRKGGGNFKFYNERGNMVYNKANLKPKSSLKDWREASGMSGVV